MSSVVKIKKCRICDSTNLLDFLFLGDIPIPNGFINKKDLKKKEKKYPLTVTFCKDCSLVQLRYIVNPKIMFQNYLYIPSSSKTRIEHFKNLAATTSDHTKLNEKSLVIDIGSNDGSLLTFFKNLGCEVLGVDPAENLVKVAELNGIRTEQGYISIPLAKKIVKKHKRASAVLATNVVAHISDLKEFLKSLDILLEEKGIFIAQFPYIVDLIKKNQFDTIYHEHLSYFSLKSLMKLSQHSNLEIYSVERNDLDGGSIRVFWKKKSNNSIIRDDKKINKLLQVEEDYGLYQEKIYLKFSATIKKIKKDTIKKIKELKAKNKIIVGYGAAAKGNIMLNYFGIGTRHIDYLVDSTPYKQGLYSPGVHIPIYDEFRIYEDKPDYLLILAWNFKKEIMEKNRQFKKNGGKFIISVPEFEIL